ncbi:MULTISPECIES: DNA (cytosine-5-)-methyltransferase [unclassified Mycobacterium]|uniref:DNA (cytosine-5-)-methyltransferase n=1 Tax=unclassified Mycobacterium TaxID=2642494 RepID=UPI0029C930CB|nr:MULTISPECIES: DNA (cytosine-5-)-methyltransferase [unclassified Mycobacterium]
MTKAQEVRKGVGYGVRLVRGPFINLEPHPDHTEDVPHFLRYAKDLRARGARLAADFFSGAGGLSLGLESAGFKVVLGADHEPFANRTHAHHFGGMSVDWDLSDAKMVTKVAKLCRSAGVELIAGGPPCQPFSKAGQSMIRHQVESGLRESRDARRDLWRSFLDIVQIVQPQAVVMENVPDMALDRNMFILRSIVEELEQLGYGVEERVVDAWRYGVPQVRQRLILVALRNNVKFHWPAESKRKVTVWNAIGDLPEVEGGWRPAGGADGWTEYAGPSSAFQREMRSQVAPEDLCKVFDHITRPVREDDRLAFDGMTHATKYTDLDAAHQRYRGDIFDDKYKRLNENDLSRTITAHIAKDGYWYIHPRQSRTLTVRESARIQTFPDHFRFDGPPSAAFRQIGNAVPPRLGFVIGQAVIASLDLDDDAELPTRDTGQLLAEWFRSRSDSLALPWLNARSRWEVIAGELLLDRATKTAAQRLWPVLQLLARAIERNSDQSDLRECLIDMAKNIGRQNRAIAALTLAENPALLDGSADEIKKATGLSDAVTDLATLTVPKLATDRLATEGPDEPVLVTKGVLRVARRFQANAVDRKNKLTDGRMAIARMIGFGVDARDAHLGLIELANSLCSPEKPQCHACPLTKHCAHDGVPSRTATTVTT